MKRLAWMAGGLLVLSGTALAQSQTRSTTETQQESNTYQQRQEKTTLPSQPSDTTNPQDSNLNRQDQTDLGANRSIPGTQMDRSNVSGHEATQNADEPKKHLTAVELYTKSALDNAKVAYEAAQLPQGPMDRQMFSEISSNISRDIQKAQTHLNQFQNMAKAQTAQSDVTAKRQDVLNNLKDARQANAKLLSSVSKDRSLVRDQAATIYTALKSADDSLRDIEQAYDVTSIDKIMPSEKAPVRGGDTDMNNDTNRSNLKTTTPDRSNLKTTTPDHNKKSTQPSNPSDY